jgi:hypothetical protein
MGEELSGLPNDGCEPQNERIVPIVNIELNRNMGFARHYWRIAAATAGFDVRCLAGNSTIAIRRDEGSASNTLITGLRES